VRHEVTTPPLLRSVGHATPASRASEWRRPSARDASDSRWKDAYLGGHLHAPL